MKNDPSSLNTSAPDNARLGVVARLRSRVSLWGIVLLFLLQLISSGAGQKLENPDRIKAAFLRNFAHYVTWPTDAFADESSPWCIGILGDDPFGELIEDTFEGRMEQGRSFKVFRADAVEELPTCQIVFIAEKNAAKRHEALARLKGLSVLTVGEASDFLEEGGSIRFQIKERIEMSINLDETRSVSLKIQTKMLEVSSEVLENGAIRKLR